MSITSSPKKIHGNRRDSDTPSRSGKSIRSFDYVAPAPGNVDQLLCVRAIVPEFNELSYRFLCSNFSRNV